MCQARRIKITIEYDGSCYHGWQVQDNANTVQAELEKAVYRITGETVRVTGAGRTDTGVHAFGQVAHFDTLSKISAAKFSDALNAMLPRNIAVISSEEAPPGFHARFSATGKSYEYRILNRRYRSPLFENRAWHIPELLNFESMCKAAGYFVGTHDFSSFCSAGHSVSTYERTIFSSGWNAEDGCLIYRVRGSGFLYNMVRIMVGTMVEIGLGKRSVEDIQKLLAAKDRNHAGITAPPQGLYLVTVHYDMPPEINCEKTQVQEI